MFVLKNIWIYICQSFHIRLKYKRALKNLIYYEVMTIIATMLSIHGVPKKTHFSNFRFAKPGLRVRDLPLPVKQPTVEGHVRLKGQLGSHEKV